MGLTRIYLDEHCTRLGTFEWDIVNPDPLTYLEIKRKGRSRITLNIHHSKVLSSIRTIQEHSLKNAS